MKYYKTSTGEVFAFENDGSQDHLIKPDYEALTDYAPPQCEDTVPHVVTMRQAKLALLQMDLLDEVDAMIAAPETPRSLKIEWEYASEVWRDWVNTLGLAAMLGLSDKQLDDLFILAGTK